MTTTQGAAMYNHPVAALVVGFVWLIAMIVVGLFLAAMYTCYGVVVGAQWGYGRWARRYRGSHRVAA
jgi:sterol desaturase/sphingolipid hydroxylase (fatty acid hydroxylase superfamily)